VRSATGCIARWRGWLRPSQVTVPPNATAEVWLPAAEADQGHLAAIDGVQTGYVAEDGSAVFTVGSGTYHFRVATRSKASTSSLTMPSTP
jgi:hypothetical protein